jgi:hypothetical protein
LAAESDAASVLYALSEWALVWGLVSYSPLPWQLGSMLATQRRWPLALMLEWKLQLQSLLLSQLQLL